MLDGWPEGDWTEGHHARRSSENHTLSSIGDTTQVQQTRPRQGDTLCLALCLAPPPPLSRLSVPLPACSPRLTASKQNPLRPFLPKTDAQSCCPIGKLRETDSPKIRRTKAHCGMGLAILNTVPTFKTKFSKQRNSI